MLHIVLLFVTIIYLGGNLYYDMRVINSLNERVEYLTRREKQLYEQNKTLYEYIKFSNLPTVEQVKKLHAKGLEIKDIATRLGLKQTTVRKYVKK